MVKRESDQDLWRKLSSVGHARVYLPAEDAYAVRSALDLVAAKLCPIFHAPNGKTYVADTSSTISVAAFSERAQLRFMPIASYDRGGSDDICKLGRASQALEKVAMRSLAACSRTQVRFTGDTLLDAFWYPGESSSSHSLEAPMPCPAHEDTGLITVLMDNAAALELRDPDGSWYEVPPLQYDECLVIAGHALTNITDQAVHACTHRVKRIPEPRASLVLEVRPDEWTANILNQASGSRDPYGECASASQAYAKAVGILTACTEDSSIQRNTQQRPCIVM